MQRRCRRTRLGRILIAYGGVFTAHNRQAFLKDPQAATYKEFVEAAENCQVAIIHPDKPRDPSELGLADLIARAEQFL